MRRFRGPASQCGAGKDAGSVWQVTRVTAVLQYCAHRERAPVGFCKVYPAVLDHIWPHTSWEEKEDKEILWNCSGFRRNIMTNILSLVFVNVNMMTYGNHLYEKGFAAFPHAGGGHKNMNICTKLLSMHVIFFSRYTLYSCIYHYKKLTSKAY